MRIAQSLETTLGITPKNEFTGKFRKMEGNEWKLRKVNFPENSKNKFSDRGIFRPCISQLRSKRHGFTNCEISILKMPTPTFNFSLLPRLLPYVATLRTLWQNSHSIASSIVLLSWRFEYRISPTKKLFYKI